jgi:hypothetical protein
VDVVSQSAAPPPSTEPASREPSTARAMRVATLWGCGAMLLTVGLVFLLALPFRPTGRGRDGWEDLGWLVVTALLAVAGALVTGAGAIGVGLHRGRYPRPVVTALVFVPVAVLLGGATGGLAALLAPAAAAWLAVGLTARAPHRPAGVGTLLPWREQASGRWRQVVAAGVLQRLVAAAVLSAVLAGWLLDKVGHRLGGQLHGGWQVWLACLPVLVVIPVLLLWARVPWPTLAGIVAVFAVFAALAVPGAISSAHPSPAKLGEIAEQVGVPDGYRVTDSVSARIAGAYEQYGYELPVVTAVLAPTDQLGSPALVPEAFRPAGDGTLPDAQRSPHVDASHDDQPLKPPTATGRAAAEQVQSRLLAGGWARDPAVLDGNAGGTYWLPRPARTFLDVSTGARFTRGPWVRAHVVPFGDVVLLVVSTRP